MIKNYELSTAWTAVFSISALDFICERVLTKNRGFPAIRSDDLRCGLKMRWSNIEILLQFQSQCSS